MYQIPLLNLLNVYDQLFIKYCVVYKNDVYNISFYLHLGFMRLLYFDLTRGNRIGAQLILDEFGASKGASIIARLKWRELFDNPFKEINKQKRPSKNEKLSQRQMTPVVILYKILVEEEGLNSEEAVTFLKKLTQKAAIAFLKFNVPLIKKKKWQNKAINIQKRFFKRLKKRFFNATADLEIKEDKKILMTVTNCHFATYAKELNVIELGPLFCAADKLFFDRYQPDVTFHRTQTLMSDNRPCDFSFEWKENEEKI